MRNLTQTLCPIRRQGLLLAGLLLLMLAGCAVPPPGITPTEPAAETGPDTAAFEQMVAEGRFLDAALAYSRLASETLPPQRTHYALRAAELLMTGNYVPQAFQMLREIDQTTLTPDLQARWSLLSARIALARQLPDDALNTLDGIAPLLGAEDTAMRQQFHQLRAQAYEQLNNHLETARERVILGTLLVDPEDLLSNQQAILSALRKLSPEAIQTLSIAGPPDVLNGWLELATISLSVEESGEGGAELVAWRERYPEHPAQESIIASVLAARPQALRLPRQIALILPLSDRFAKAAAAVRDGFLAAYYAQDTSPPEGSFNTPSSFVPGIRIYDEGSDPTTIELVYEQAINDGAEFVVGPLNKDAVSRLAERSDLPVPVLALNYSEHHGHSTERPVSPNLFQISLSPEQEAQQVAERAWLDGHNRAAIIAPNTAWGERVAKAFSERWLQFGGHVVEKQSYDAKKSDYSLPIRKLLNVDESQQRRRELRRLLGQKLEYIPRRRQDVDFIFMAASSRQARLIRPQLRFHHAPKVPVYATSHSYGGTVDADMDRDMNGVMFADMPWTLTTERDTSGLKAEITALWPNEAKRYSRLYALGVDAYHIIGQLNTLRRNRSDYYRGETGDLYLDINNRLQRRLIWARFERGIPQRLDEL
jgi:outer membrane PBP1 activator LpoA protein